MLAKTMLLVGGIGLLATWLNRNDDDYTDTLEQKLSDALDDAERFRLERNKLRDSLVEKWHAGDGNDQTLAQYLGMSAKEYGAWVVNPDS